MDLGTKRKRYCGKFALAGTTLLASLAIANIAGAANITAPTGGNGTDSEPYYFINVTEVDVTNSDTITRGTTLDPDTELLSLADVAGEFRYLVHGISSRETGFLNTGDITLSISKNLEDSSTNFVSVHGIRGDYSVDNDGQITIEATGRTIDPDTYFAETVTKSYDDAVAEAAGIDSDVGTNNGTIAVTANGGTAHADGSTAHGESDAYVDAYADGIDGDVESNTGAISVTANGGNAYAENHSGNEADADAYVEAAGVDGEVETNTGAITVKATGGNAYAESDLATAADDDTYADADADADAEAVGIDDNVGTNDGIITIEAQGGNAYAIAESAARADAEGMAAGIGSDILTNESAINVLAKGGEAFASVTEANSSWGYADADADADAAGIYDDVETNNGAITVTANGGKAEARVDNAMNSGAAADANADADAWGIDGDVGINTGVIIVTASGGEANAETDSYATNTEGETSADADAEACGIEGNVGTNEGAITVIANAGVADANARIYDMGEADTYAYASAGAVGIKGDININIGDITIEATGGVAISDAAYSAGTTGASVSANAYASAEAFGIDGDVGTNDGTITVTATGGEVELLAADESYGGDAWAEAFGIDGNVDINNGDITVEAIGGTTSRDGTTGVDGAWAVGINTEQTTLLTNTGTISTTAAGGYVTATGIHFYGTTGSLYSSGLISAQALPAENSIGTNASAYQVYSENTLSITGYAMKFNSQEQVDSDYSNAIFIAPDDKASDEKNLDDKNSVFDNATLYAYTDNHFNNGDTFEIPTLVEDADVSDQFTTAQLGITSPDYQLALIDGEGEELQQISITYNPQNSTPLIATQVSQRITSNSVGIVKSNLMTPMLGLMQKSNPQFASYEGVRLASTDPILTAADMDLEVMPQERGWGFVMPYYSNLSDSSSPMGYDADIYGITGGYNHWMSSDFILGFHAGYGKGDIDFTGTGYNQKEEDVDAGSLGIQGMYRLGSDWLIDGVASFFYTGNDYNDYNPLNRESGDYNTHGLDATMTLNYVYAVTPQNSLVPSLGLRYLWQHADSYTAINLNSADVTYGDVDENQLYAQLGVDWFGNFQTDSKWHIVSNVGVGVEQALTDNEFSNTMTVGTAQSTVSTELDDTSLTTNASIEFSKNSMAFSVGYAGSYSSDLKDSSINLQMKYFF